MQSLTHSPPLPNYCYYTPISFRSHGLDKRLALPTGLFFYTTYIHIEMSTPTPDRERYCFVTVGATAAFDALIRAVLSPNFLSALAKHGYTNLLVQFGKDGRELFTTAAEATGRNGTHGIKVQGFDLTTKLREIMRIASGAAGRKEGVVVCHAGMSSNFNTYQTDGHGANEVYAGTGSVLDAIRIGVPVIVVPNTALLDNHQLEFAEQMARMEYVVHGNIEYVHTPRPQYACEDLTCHLSDLSSTLTEAEDLRAKIAGRPPPNSGEERKGSGLEGVLDEEMGIATAGHLE
jgi:beta-1,4-N-acetylglucosaminyltransferase